MAYTFVGGYLILFAQAGIITIEGGTKAIITTDSPIIRNLSNYFPVFIA
ncbi:MAG: hypothetical protein WBX01_08340 [Nitrososphaeraceae archaeon]|jgi:hypothetical protein